MTDPKTPPDRKPDRKPEAEEQDDAARVRALILQRRNRFIAAAIAGLGAAQTACSDSHGPDNPTPSNQQAGQGSQAGQGGRAGSGPNVCLSLPIAGSGTAGTGTAGRGGSGGAGAAPSVCLSPSVCLDIVEECWDNQPPPCVCLEPPFMEEDAGADDGSHNP